MIKRTVFISNPYHLSTKLSQLVLKEKETKVEKSIPIEDIGFLVLEHPQISFTQSVISLLAQNNTAVVFCSDNYLPVSMLYHIDTNQIQNQLFRAQLSISEALRKNLWKQTIVAKIRNQAAMLDYVNMDSTALKHISTKVLAGDTDNREAKAAMRYWPAVFGREFRRDRNGDAPNPALNYGYTILRAAVARALCGSGLLPTIGIFHHNKYNHFCLADDIMEPYRAWVDRTVWEMHHNGMDTANLGKSEKATILKILTEDVHFGKNKSPLMVGLTQTSASLVGCFNGHLKKIKYPSLCGTAV